MELSRKSFDNFDSLFKFLEKNMSSNQKSLNIKQVEQIQPISYPPCIEVPFDFDMSYEQTEYSSIYPGFCMFSEDGMNIISYNIKTSVRIITQFLYINYICRFGNDNIILWIKNFPQGDKRLFLQRLYNDTLYWIHDEREDFKNYLDEIGCSQYLRQTIDGIPYCGLRSIDRYAREHYNDTDFSKCLAIHLFYMMYNENGMEENEEREAYRHIMYRIMEDCKYSGSVPNLMKEVQHHLIEFGKMTQINVLTTNPLVTSTPKMDDDFFVSWSYVTFLNGRICIEHPTSKSISRPFVIPQSKSAYNKIKRTFLYNLPPIFVRAEKGIINKLLDMPNIAKCIKTIEIKSERAKIVKEKQTFSTQIKQMTQHEIIGYIKSKNSEYLNHLCIIHKNDYKITYCQEYRVNSSNVTNETFEEAFIFILSPTIVIFENVLPSRSSILFSVSENKIDEAICDICAFFASTEINKREKLMEKKIRIESNYIHGYKRIMHIDFSSWQYDLRKEIIK